MASLRTGITQTFPPGPAPVQPGPQPRNTLFPVGVAVSVIDIGGVKLRNRVFLAPMSGITDCAFRVRAYAHGAGLVVSVMVAIVVNALA